MSIFDTVASELATYCADVFSIGNSVCGLPIACAHCGGYGGRQIIVTAAIHARECYTALVVLRQVKEFCGSRCCRGDGAYFIPLVNPDGALFFESGAVGEAAELPPVLKRFAASRREWKANANGVDLNCNFDARWGSGMHNKRVVGASDYIGEYPLCAPETNALAGFTTAVMPAATVSYHCMGGELYWEFFQDGAARARDKAFATTIADKIGVKRVDGHLNSAGGYKDWCVSRLGIPSVTIELIRSGSHPFSADDFALDTEVNATLPMFILDILK